MTSFSKGILAIGDCITSGVSNCLGNSYPERVGMALNVPVKNCGKAMCSSREGITLLRDNDSEEFDCVIIQFGLKDAYLTFKYSPNILYYPDNFIRKQLRNIVKKYKKICKKIGLNELLGTARVVSEHDYRNNILKMVDQCQGRQIILPEIIPSQELYRNESLQQYNKILEQIAKSRNNCLYISIFDDFLKKIPEYYLDVGHPNAIGYGHISEKILEKLGSHVSKNEQPH